MKNRMLQEVLPPQTPKNYQSFLNTIHQYAERLKEEKDLSLSYLNQMNQMSEELRLKDLQIERLTKVNKQLSQKLALYNSVISRSRTTSPLRMSKVIGINNITQSIIQTHNEPEQQINRPFQQFFILDLSEMDKKLIKYRYAFESRNQILEEVVTSFIDNCDGPEWHIQVFGVNQNHKTSKSMMCIYNSPFTTKKQLKIRSELINQINPSTYYYLFCIVQKELVSLGGKYCWAPILYGFVSYFPFPSLFFQLLEEIRGELSLKNEIDLKKLDESLHLLNNVNIKKPIDSHFNFLNRMKGIHVPENIEKYILSYSTDLLSTFSLDLVIDVLMLLLLEIPITIISTSQELVSKFMFYFIYIMKPLKYPYPIIFNLTEKMKTLLESPFPTFIGTTNAVIIEKYIYERAVFDLDKKVAKSWPVIDSLDSPRTFLLNIAHRVGSFEKLFLVTQEIIKGHQYRELEPYWKDFTRTQIYNNYLYNQ